MRVEARQPEGEAMSTARVRPDSVAGAELESTGTVVASEVPQTVPKLEPAAAAVAVAVVATAAVPQAVPEVQLAAAAAVASAGGGDGATATPPAPGSDGPVPAPTDVELPKQRRPPSLRPS